MNRNFKKIGIKYCGGCNPLFDRKKYVQELERENGVPLEIAVEELEYDLIYVVCGCPVCCADISGLKAKEFIFTAENGRYIRKAVVNR